jgi:long-chain acyl-CoA synthetase
MLVTQGKNLFPEEVEAALCRSGLITHASVHGVPDPLRGQQVVALVKLQQSAPDPVLPTALALAHSCRETLEHFKVPKRFFTCDTWPLTPSGKTDHQALERMLAQYLHPAEHTTPPPCLQPLP